MRRDSRDGESLQPEYQYTERLELVELPIVPVLRVWADGRLVWSATDEGARHAE